jgi:hypothetical protein
MEIISKFEAGDSILFVVSVPKDAFKIPKAVPEDQEVNIDSITDEDFFSLIKG